MTSSNKKQFHLSICCQLLGIKKDWQLKKKKYQDSHYAVYTNRSVLSYFIISSDRRLKHSVIYPHYY